MEQQSIRSSQVKGTQCRLRRIDQSLQETTQRFVESLSKDIRINQFADPEYASKKIENDIWYWLTPLESGRTGFLIFLPNQPAVWFDEYFKQGFNIPIRVSPQIYEKKSVFIASLDRQDSLLRLEDSWMVAGEFLRSKSFTKRWEKLTEFFQCHFKQDSHLQQGLRIELANLLPLSSIETWDTMLNVPNCMFAQGETSPRRLRIPLQNQSIQNQSIQKPYNTPNQTPKPSNSSPKLTPKPSPKLSSKPILQTKQCLIEKDDNSPRSIKSTPFNPNAPVFIPENNLSLTPSALNSIAKAIPHEEYPDTYYIYIQNVKKGYAAVQDLELSLSLRKKVSEKKNIRVKVEWNEEFNMYEICNVLEEEQDE